MQARWARAIKAGPVLLVAALALVACGQAAQTQPPATAQPPTTAIEAPTAVPQPSAAPTPTVAPTATAVPSYHPASELIGGGPWLNSEPLTLEALRGQVVLIDFWTYGCINCQRTIPYVQQWWNTYKDQGLVIIGVHTPELESEKNLENVQAAVANQGVTWPVVQDNEKQIWRAYKNRYWPRFYLVDKQGNIIYDHIGEGAYAETERRIVEALAQ